jgi:hypothetical protein
MYWQINLYRPESGEFSENWRFVLVYILFLLSPLKSWTTHTTFINPLLKTLTRVLILVPSKGALFIKSLFTLVTGEVAQFLSLTGQSIIIIIVVGGG